jgi:hypothetical protein
MKNLILLRGLAGDRVFSIIVENRHGGINIHNCPPETIERMESRFEIKLK